MDSELFCLKHLGMCSFKDILVYRLSNDSQLRTSLMAGGLRSEALLELLGLGHSQLRTSLMVGEFRSEALLELLGLGQTSNFSWDEPNLGVSVKRGVYLFFKECCFRVRIRVRLGLHCKSERSVLAQKIGPFRWVKYSPIFESNLAPLNQRQCNSVSYGWLRFFGLDCAEIAPGRAESDFGLQGWIDTLGLKQIFLIFSVG